MNVSELISTRRKTLGLTYEEIGNAVGVSKSTVRKWEKGMIKNMRRDKLAALAKVLQISPSALIEREEFSQETIEVAAAYEKADLPTRSAVRRVLELPCAAIKDAHSVSYNTDEEKPISARHALAAIPTQQKRKTPTVADDTYTDDEILVRAAHRSTRSIDQLNNPDSL